ncbi:MAG: DeoR family transcriptional regulator [Parcubacteria group bacterium]
METNVQFLKSIYKVVFKIQNSFYERLLLDELDSLLPDIAKITNRSENRLIAETIVRLDYLLKIVAIIRYQDELPINDSLLLERDILCFKASLLRTNGVVTIKESQAQSSEMSQKSGKKKLSKKTVITKKHENIMDIIKKQGTVRGSDMARQLGISERTFRRQANDLVNMGIIERIIDGRRVHYKNK